MVRDQKKFENHLFNEIKLGVKCSVLKISLHNYIFNFNS